MSLVIVSSNTLIFQSARDKEEYILQRPVLVDGAVTELLAPWRDDKIDREVTKSGCAVEKSAYN